jgi:hypothetical protein
VRDFRIKLFKEYLGDVKDSDISDVLSERFVKEWEGTAYNNTHKYRFVFGCYPDDEMVSYEAMKKIRNDAQPKLYERIRKEFKGFLVEFPLLITHDSLVAERIQQMKFHQARLSADGEHVHTFQIQQFLFAWFFILQSLTEQ